MPVAMPAYNALSALRSPRFGRVSLGGSRLGIVGASQLGQAYGTQGELGLLPADTQSVSGLAYFSNKDTTAIALSAIGQTINATTGNDSLVGTNDDDTLNGLEGDDTLRGGLGADTLNGRALSFDADGNGATQAVLLGTFQGSGQLALGDIWTA